MRGGAPVANIVLRVVGFVTIGALPSFPSNSVSVRNFTSFLARNLFRYEAPRRVYVPGYHDSRFLATDNIRTSDSIRSPVDPRYLLDSVTQGFHLSYGRSSSRILYSGENSTGKKKDGRVSSPVAELVSSAARITGSGYSFGKRKRGPREWYFSEDLPSPAACLKNILPGVEGSRMDGGRARDRSFSGALHVKTFSLFNSSFSASSWTAPRCSSTVRNVSRR